MYSRVSERAFDALLTKLFETIEQKAEVSGCRGPMADGYKNGYLLSYFSMMFAEFEEDVQFQIYHHVSDRIIRLRKDISAKTLELTDREVNIA